MVVCYEKLHQELKLTIKYCGKKQTFLEFLIGHEKFESIRNVPVVLYPATNQMAGKPAYQTTIGEAVDGFDRVRNKINDEEYTSIGFSTKPNEIS